MQEWDVLSWLSEPSDQAVRYATLRRLLGRPEGDVDVIWARLALYAGGRVPAILATQSAEGSWPVEGANGTAKFHFQGTAGQLVLLAELGASREHPQVALGCEWLLSHVQATNGSFPLREGSYIKKSDADVLCLDARTIWALVRLGYHNDPRVLTSVHFLTETAQHANLVCSYQKTTNSPCMFAATKLLRVYSALPEDLRRQGDIPHVVRRVADLLLADDYTRTGRSPQWKRLGFPRGHHSDVLERAEVLVDLGMGHDPRLQPALRHILRKREPSGAWLLDETLTSLPVSIERKGFPSKWITLRALYVLYKVGMLDLSRLVRQQQRQILP